MKNTTHHPSTPSLLSLFRRWFTFGFHLEGLSIGEDEVLLDLCCGRD